MPGTLALLATSRRYPRMPFGNPELSDDQAFDVAACINSHARPEMSDPERDYPDRTKKPIDSAYPATSRL